MATIRPSGSVLSGLLFLASAIGGLWFEYTVTLAYDASQPYDWILESMSDLGVRYRQVHPLKHHSVTSWRSKTMNFGLMWTGVLFALAHLYVFTRARQQPAANVAAFRTVRVILAILFAGGAILMAQVQGGPREKHFGTIGWHWNGFAMMAIAGNLNSILAGLQAHQVGGLDGNPLYRALSLAFGLIGMASFAKFNLLGEWNYLTKIGIWQRGSVYPVAAWQILTGLGLISSSLLSLRSKPKRA